jgi:hypothetical protein
LFGDVGRFDNKHYITRHPVPNFDIVDQVKSDLGIGLQFSLNIPDYLGKDRGFALRYEIPFWLSDPSLGEKSFKFRNLIGIGAIISL